MFGINKFKRYVNQNIKKIITIIIAITIVIAIIQALNATLKNQNKERIIIENKNDVLLEQGKTAIYGSDVKQEKQQENNIIINSFVDFCNNKQTDKAYELLTNECKEKLYPTLQIFENNYYKLIFNEKRNISIQSWINSSNAYTYKVKFTNDILSSGKLDNGNAYEDYFTIIDFNGVNKLNINNYIKTDKINKTKSNKNINITVISRDIYLNKEIYNIKVENDSLENIILDSKEETDNIYLKDSNKLNWKSDLSNIDNLEISSKSNKDYNIVFNRSYNNSVSIKSIVFSNIKLINESIKINIDI